MNLSTVARTNAKTVTTTSNYHDGYYSKCLLHTQHFQRGTNPLEARQQTTFPSNTTDRASVCSGISRYSSACFRIGASGQSSHHHSSRSSAQDNDIGNSSEDQNSGIQPPNLHGQPIRRWHVLTGDRERFPTHNSLRIGQVRQPPVLRHYKFRIFLRWELQGYGR
jgi:hypothetical protein